MITANEKYFDAALRHHIEIRRFTIGQLIEIKDLLERADRDLVAKLRKRLTGLGTPGSFKSKRMIKILADMRRLRKATLSVFAQGLTKNLKELSKIEAAFEVKLLDKAIPIEYNFANVSAVQLNAIVTSQPFQGHLLKDWFSRLASNDAMRLEGALQLGLAQGESVNSIVQRIAGTRAMQYADGALSITRRNAEAVTRTAINHVSNKAREAVWEENADIIAGMRWTSTLDGRTTMLCQGRDGLVAPIEGKPIPETEEPLQPPGARPPAHFRCRSIMVAILDGEGIVGKRPYVIDDRTRRKREINFRQMAKKQGRPVKEIRSEWAAKNIGQVPAKLTYNDWLKRQKSSFQDKVLGKGKGEIFRSGKLKLNQFVDRKGNELTLEQLRRKIKAQVEIKPKKLSTLAEISKIKKTLAEIRKIDTKQIWKEIQQASKSEGYILKDKLFAAKEDLRELSLKLRRLEKTLLKKI
jgi:hypothetical protein